ncbi:MAG: hypothetical protein OEZ13_05665 [Spirochaetia bacterium]|nr:hypothetical protein [Spirochaetia bacterium]
MSDDFLKVKPEFWKEKKITGIISNLPFYITSDIIIKIIKEMKFINCALLGMQKEMAERILKKKGSSISIFLNITGDTKKAAFVSRKNFYPEPEVDSIWIYWLRNKTFNDIDNLELLLRASFWGKRKTMLNNIRNNPYFKKDENKLKIAKFSENIINDSNMKNILSKRPDILEKEDFLNFLQFF